VAHIDTSWSRASTALVGILLGIAPLHAIELSVAAVGPSYCGGPDGSIYVDVLGGLPPFTVTWYDAGGGVFQESSSSVANLALEGLYPGVYSLTVVDSQMDVASTGPIEVVIDGAVVLDIQAIATCPGEPPIAVVNMFQNGIVDIWGADVIDSSQQLDECGQFTYRALMFPSYGSYQLQFEDQNGCILDAWVGLNGPETLPVMQVVDVAGSCSNGASGSITVSFGGFGTLPQVVTRLKNSAGAVVAGGCASAGIELAGLIGTPYTFTGLAPGTYWVHVSGQTFNFDFTDWYDYQCLDSIEVVVPALPGDCGVVNGRVFVDNNANCATNSGENNLPATVVRLEPGPYYGNTSSNGQYSVQVPYGSYEVFAEHPVLEQSCPVVQVVQQAVHNNVNVPMEVGAQLDMQVTMSDGAARPGFQYQVAVQVNNLTADAAGTVSLMLEHDALLGLVSATPAPTSTAGNVLTWTGAAFSFTNAFQSRTVQLRFQVPPDVGLLGTDLLTAATVSTTSTDADLSNNTFVLLRTITGAYDPNDKLAYTSSGNTDVWQLGADEWIDYTIRFQNTGTDTAFNVVITDTLPSNLDPGSIITGASSHNFTWELRDAGTLKFYFPNILLPDSNINEPRSHGFVSFRMLPHLPIAPGTIIENIANIYFDFNPPVITDPSVLVAEFSTGVGEVDEPRLQLSPVPVNDQLNVSSYVEIRSVRIFTVDGREVDHRSIKATSGTIDVSVLNAGAYLLVARMSNGSTVRKRFIKQ
jgi:uncharacterized repeat protein (TIGR01451 family)